MTNLTVPNWIDRLDLVTVSRLKLESHHGIPKEVQNWPGMTKDVDDCPAYLTTMLEHRGTTVGLHQKLSKNLGDELRELSGDPTIKDVALNFPKPDELSNEMILRALRKTYAEANLSEFWEVCERWRDLP